jgi:outer membrane protein insertion porin family
VEQVGILGGDFDFTRFEAEHKVFIPVFEDYLDRRTVLSFSTRVAYIPQGRDETPTYERFYLGGSSMRGLEFRTVSPRGVRNDNGEPSVDPIGGTFLFFAGVEIQQPIFEELFSIVGFIDSGTVTFDPGFEDYRVTAGFGLRFYVPQLSPAPLAFDFGIPLLSESTDEDRLFTFSIDLPFQ